MSKAGVNISRQDPTGNHLSASNISFNENQRTILLSLLQNSDSGSIAHLRPYSVPGLLIMRRCKIRTWIISVTLLYMGFSPAMVNSALSLYSEIAVYPFLLGIILFVAAAWQSLCAGIPGYKILPYATGFALCFIVSTLTKAAFELIFRYFLYLFFLLGLRFLSSKKLFRV